MQPSTSPRRDHLEFAAALDRVLARTGGSHVWSPHSVGTVLGLLAAGASGRTLDELEALLGPDTKGQLEALDAAVDTGSDPDLATLNGLYVPADLEVLPDFEARVRGRAGAEVGRADFARDAEGVRSRINGKVADVTRGLIRELLPPGGVRPDLRMLLVNALWVKVVWPDPFDPAQTRARTFHTPDGKRRVPTMHRSARLPHAQARGWSMVSLEGDHELVLDVLLPDGRTTAPPPVSAEVLADLYRERSSQQVELTLPRFRVETDTSLLEPLAAVGVRRMATDEARFDGISPEPLRADEILHQSVLRVDEKGAEGAAATAVMMLRAAFTPTRPVRFTVDRPFVFVLRRRESVLFLGRVTDPVDPGPAA
ncbi:MULTISPECIES: serpin family protein [Nocardiopsis]|uniref:Proteinase inhibitor I4 serpin n=1 Tax=Nocardiopsis sinuspersici TaxID=501010 RepID=A0A1V3C0Z1_9ACTN|nr:MULTISPECIES: serpin family protein [Nocardiopsis]OOC54471.1 proteinase inhibitor I4 serpin [Nocardiopsis sinuspersici]